MSLKRMSTGFTVVLLASAAISSQAVASGQPANPYWQAPNWSGYSSAPRPNTAPPAYRQQRPANSYPPQARPAGPYAGQQNRNTGNMPPPPGPYSGQYNQPARPTTARPPVRQAGPAPGNGYYAPRPYYGPDNGASAYSMPGYNPYRRSSGGWSSPWGNNRGGNNRWNSNKFWGRSGPDTWMHPGKDNWENSWDDMINSPSRMGEMPGGWTAPEVTMPNPIDMGDQMQENVQDLPDQMKNMDVGNDVN